MFFVVEINTVGPFEISMNNSNGFLALNIKAPKAKIFFMFILSENQEKQYVAEIRALGGGDKITQLWRKISFGVLKYCHFFQN